jgi:hypothetical protein
MITAGGVVVLFVDVSIENIGILSRCRIEAACIVSEILS